MAIAPQDAAVLPAEICESVVDFCCSDKAQKPSKESIQDSYRVLRACCLTSRSWLSRSRFNLYSIVMLQRHDDVSSFLSTIATHRFLADYTRALYITPLDPSASSYIGYARHELVKALRNIRVLLLGNASWKEYPPRYHELVAQYPVTELRLSTDIMMLKDILPLIWALRHLEFLQLHTPAPRLRVFTEEAVLMSALASRRPRCVTLRTLELTFNLIPVTNFPPRLIFGTAITVLLLQRTYCAGLPATAWSGITSDTSNDRLQALLDYVASLNSLQKLTLEVDRDRYDFLRPEEWIASILAQLRGHAALEVVCLSYWPRHINPAAPLLVYRPEYAFLDLLSSPSFPEILYALPALRVLAVELTFTEGTPYHQARWWEERFRARLPSMKAEIRVTIHTMPSYYPPFSPKIKEPRTSTTVSDAEGW